MTINKLLKTRLIKSTTELIRSRQASVLKKFIAAAADADKQEYYLKILLDLALYEQKILTKIAAVELDDNSDTGTFEFEINKQIRLIAYET
jgi:hypothetical protein